MDRRSLLRAAAVAGPALVAGRVFAAAPGAPGTQPRLLVVFLRGAYDAANVVAPVGSDFYHQSRPTLALAKPGTGPDAALTLDADWALHPALKETIHPLFEKGQVAFVPFAGTDDASRSHFETQDTIELGQPVGPGRAYGSGFMSRLAAELAGAPGATTTGVPMGVQAISFTDQLPITFRGGPAIPNIGLNAVGKPGVDDRQAGLIRSMYAKTPLSASVDEGFTVRDEVYQSISAGEAASNRGAVTPKGFELSARRVGRLMREHFNLGFLDVGGWDTHVNQGGANGYLANRLGELGRGLAGFVDEVGPDAWNDTAVIVVSEFGRTFRENGDKGTDHGHGSVHWVLGGRVKGGRMAGEQVAITRAALFQDRDLPVLNDYRSLIGDVAGRLYGLGPDRLGRVFPSAPRRDFALV